MTGAMYAAIGGLKSHMSKLNVIGNNVANVNTYGYKAGRMTFKESMYTTSRSGSNGGITAGGNNPSQIGYGCSVGSIDLNMSPSTYAPTGVGLDCYIDGEGFYMVGDKLQLQETDDGNGNVTSVWTGGITKGDQVKDMDLTRVGDFWIDPDGYICNRDGKVLYGFARVQNPNYVPAPAAGTADNRTDEQKQETIISTHLVPLRVPLSAAAPTTDNKGIVTGADGNPQRLWEAGDPVYPYLNADGTNQYMLPDGEAKPPTAGAATGYGSSRYPVAENTAANAVSNVMPLQLQNVQIGKDGSIYGTAPNKQTVVIGYVAIATPDSPDGVTHIDGPYYRAMGGAGNLRVNALGLDLPTKYLGNKLAPGSTPPAGGGGPGVAEDVDNIMINSSTELRNGGLEASSTDVAEEFSQMITTQRGYQANTRIITVTDSMLEELVNMKR